MKREAEEDRLLDKSRVWPGLFLESDPRAVGHDHSEDHPLAPLFEKPVCLPPRSASLNDEASAQATTYPDKIPENSRHI